MMQKVRSKMKIVVQNYSYEEYERNRGIYSLYLCFSSVFIALFIGCFILLSLLFHEFQFIYLIYSLIVLGVIAGVLDERKRLENEYLRYAKKEWCETRRTELCPREMYLLEDSDFRSLLSYARSVRVRSDVVIKSDTVEYYVPTKEYKAKRNTLPLHSVICRTSVNDRSFLIVETRCFEDERFEFLAQQVGVPFKRSRMIIESDYIQWKG